MNNKLIQVLLILVSILMVRVAFSNTLHSVDTLSKVAAYNDVVGSDVNDRYTLPPSKVHIESCRREGQLRHPGMIERQQILHRYGDFWLRFEIQERGGSEWLELCSLETGKIIREQKLIDAAS
ncbi:MAG: hypothetical protein ACXV8O_03050 [Methylobacter sp.]